MDPHHFNAYPDPSFHVNADRGPTFHLNADSDLDPALHQSDANLRSWSKKTLRGSILSLHASILSLNGSI